MVAAEKIAELYGVEPEKVSGIFNRVITEADRITKTSSTLGELRRKLLDFVNREFRDETERQIARLFVDMLYTKCILLRLENTDKVGRSIPLLDVALYIFFTGFTAKIDMDSDKLVMTPDYEAIERVYGFKKEEIADAVNNWVHVKDNLSTSVAKHFKILVDVIAEHVKDELYGGE